MNFTDLYLRKRERRRIDWPEVAGTAVGLALAVVCILGALHMPAFIVWLARNF